MPLKEWDMGRSWYPHLFLGKPGCLMGCGHSPAKNPMAWITASLLQLGSSPFFTSSGTLGHSQCIKAHMGILTHTHTHTHAYA